MTRVGEWIFSRTPILIILTVLPAALLFVLVGLLPIMWGIWLSFNEASAFNPVWHWTGLGNFTELWGSSRFWSSALKSIEFGLGSVLVQIVLGVTTALLLIRRFHGNTLVRTLILLPYLIPTVVVGLIFRWMFNPSYGMVNRVLLQMGVLTRPISFFGSIHWTMPAIIIANSWKFAIFITIMCLARLESIPRSQYEAAAVSGAGPIRQFRDITLPHLKGVLLIAILLRGIWMFNKFDIIWILTKGGPGRVTTTLPVSIYKTAFLQGDLGLAGAIGALLFLLLAIVAIIYFVVFKPEEEVRVE